MNNCSDLFVVPYIIIFTHKKGEKTHNLLIKNHIMHID